MSKQFTKPFNPINWPAAPHDFTGVHNLGIYAVETTQRYVYGTRYITWDGRVFKYYNAEGATVSYHAASRIDLASACSVYVNAAVASQIGDSSLSWTTQSTARVEDDLAGGFVEIYDKSAGTALFRAIVGNDASGTTYTKLYLEYPLEIAIETSTPDAMEVFENPYGDLTAADSSASPWMGVPTTGASTGDNGWMQTWGPCVVSPGSGSVSAPEANERTLIFYNNGTLGTQKDGYATGYQVAGYSLIVGASAYGPVVMLQCSS